MMLSILLQILAKRIQTFARNDRSLPVQDASLGFYRQPTGSQAAGSIPELNFWTWNRRGTQALVRTTRRACMCAMGDGTPPQTVRPSQSLFLGVVQILSTKSDVQLYPDGRAFY